MTVHGAKGLEADIVFLVDNGARPVDRRARSAPPVARRRSRSAQPGAARLDAQRSSRCRQACARRVDAWRERAEEEYRRLLYVGMTRARDRLYVVGIAKQNTDHDNGWHALVRSALEPEVDRDRGRPTASSRRSNGAPRRAARSPANAERGHGARRHDRPAGLGERSRAAGAAAVAAVTPSSALADGDGEPRFAVRAAFRRAQRSRRDAGARPRPARSIACCSRCPTSRRRRAPRSARRYLDAVAPATGRRPTAPRCSPR